MDYDKLWNKFMELVKGGEIEKAKKLWRELAEAAWKYEQLCK